jgi:hypothetical protein
MRGRAQGLKGREPALHMIHLLLPHQPWRFYPSGRQYRIEPNPLAALGPVIDQQGWPSNPLVALHGYQRHLLQVGYADTLLGRLVHKLRSDGLYDRSLLIVVADHGISFRPGQQPRSVGAANAPDIAPVPLFVKLPGQLRGRISDRVVRTIDVVPTIAAVLNATPTAPVEGQSVFDPSYRLHRKIRIGSEGEGVSVAVPGLLRARDAAARRRSAVFGAHLQRLFALGPASGLFGRTIRPGPLITVATGSSVTLENTTVSASAAAAGIRPGLLTGRVHGALARAGVPLVISVAKHVAATTEVESSGARSHFSAILPEWALRGGTIRPAVWAATRRGDGWGLAALPAG